MVNPSPIYKYIYPSTYLEMEELQLRLLEKQLATIFVLFWGKKAIFSQKMAAPSKKVIALNMYIGTNVLMYERWLVLKVRYTAGRPPGPTLSPFHRLYACESKIACLAYNKNHHSFFVRAETQAYAITQHSMVM